nr:hypothetical protein [Endozoicomonas sp.]
MNELPCQNLDGSKNHYSMSSYGLGTSQSGVTDRGRVAKIVKPLVNCKIKVSDKQDENCFVINDNENQAISLLAAKPLDEDIDQFAVPANACMRPIIKVSDIPGMYEKLLVDCKVYGFQLTVTDDKLTIEVTENTTTNLLHPCEGSNDYEKLKGLETRKSIQVLNDMTFFLFGNFDCYFVEKQIYPLFTCNYNEAYYKINVSFKQDGHLYRYLKYLQPSVMPEIEGHITGDHINCLDVGWNSIVFVNQNVEFLYTRAIGPCISLVLHSKRKGLALFTHLNYHSYSKKNMDELYDFCIQNDMADMEATIIGGMAHSLDGKGGYFQLRDYINQKSITVAHEFIGGSDDRPHAFLFDTKKGVPYSAPDWNLENELKKSGISVSFYPKKASSSDKEFNVVNYVSGKNSLVDSVA